MFYTYRQNNSGGFFTEPAVNVIIEAKNADHANDIAESKGLYFDGEGDCPCCGDRWYAVDKSDGTKRPQIYGKSIDKYLDDATYLWGTEKVPDVAVYYLDGREESFLGKAALARLAVNPNA